MYLHFYWHIPFVGNRYYNWFTYLIKKSTGILRLFWSLKLFCWVGFNSRWGCIYLMIALDWGSIRNLRGWGCIQEWGSIQAHTVYESFDLKKVSPNFIILFTIKIKMKDLQLAGPRASCAWPWNLILTKLRLIYVQKSTTFVNTCYSSVNLVPALLYSSKLHKE